MWRRPWNVKSALNISTLNSPKYQNIFKKPTKYLYSNLATMLYRLVESCKPNFLYLERIAIPILWCPKRYPTGKLQLPILGRLAEAIDIDFAVSQALTPMVWMHRKKHWRGSQEKKRLAWQLFLQKDCLWRLHSNSLPILVSHTNVSIM